MKKLTTAPAQQPAEDTPEVRMETLQAIAATRQSLEEEVRETNTAVMATAANVAAIEHACLRDERPESEMKAAQGTHWNARKAHTQASDALAVHQATYPTLTADIQRVSAELERKKFEARHEDYQGRVAVFVALMEKVMPAALDVAGSYENGFTHLPLDTIFGNQFHVGEFGMLKKAIATAYPHLLDPADPVCVEARRVAAYLLDHERDPATGMSPMQARTARAKAAVTVETKTPGWLDGLKAAVGIA